jgi:glycosyltransferase involved in cell wall biosynthesis
MGGAEQVLKIIATYYSANGYEVDVFFLTKHIGNLWDNVNDKINLFYTASKSESKGLYQLYSNIKKNRKEYMYGYTSHIYLNSFIGLLRKLKFLHVNYLIGRDSHSYFLVEQGRKRFLYNVLINIGYSGLDLLICQTEEMTQQFVANKQRLSKTILIKTISNPIDLKFDYAQNSINALNSNDKFIVAAGRLIKIKCFDTLIKSFAKLNLKDYRLIILGEGEERKNLEQLILSLNIEKQVALIGFVNNVYLYFKKAKLCVVSSAKEGFPNVLLQMMSQNEKVVSTLCSGAIEDIEGLFTCQTNNIDALYQAIKLCLETDTTSNRKLFDNELEERSIDKFINKINDCVCRT